MESRKHVKDMILLTLCAAAGITFIALTLYGMEDQWNFMCFGLFVCMFAAWLVHMRFLGAIERAEKERKTPEMSNGYYAAFAAVVVTLLVWEGVSYGLDYPESHMYRINIIQDVDNRPEELALGRAETLNYTSVLNSSRYECGMERTAEYRSYPKYIDKQVIDGYCKSIVHSRLKQERGSFGLYYEANVEAAHELYLSARFVRCYCEGHSQHKLASAVSSVAIWNQTGFDVGNWYSFDNLTIDVDFGYLVKMDMEYWCEPNGGGTSIIRIHQFVLMDADRNIKVVAVFRSFLNY